MCLLLYIDFSLALTRGLILIEAAANVASWQILLQKSAGPNGCPSVIRLRATGFDLPVLTLSTQLSRYAMH